MRDYDCLIIGYNDISFADYMNMLKSMGTDHADYRDLNLNFIEYNNKPYRALDILTHFYCQENKEKPPFHNHDLLWMAVTYLGTYLSRRGFTFDFVNLFQQQKEQLRKKLQENNYLTIAVTTTIYTFDLPILEVVSFVRKYNKTAKIIVGGPYISKRSETMEKESLQSVFKYMDADFYVFCREGEQALVNIIRTLKTNGDFSKFDNLAFRKGSDYVITQASKELNPLEENMVDYSLFPREEIGKTVNIRVSKGCPFSCAFCGFPLRAEKYKYLSVNIIQKELDAIRDLGTVTNLFFIDDTINVPLKRFKEVLRMMIKQQYGFKWNCLYRCDIYDEESIRLMKEAGCDGVFLGLESANDNILKNMNKTARKKDYLEAMEFLKKYGINIFVSLIVGFPGETYETFQETVDFLEETKPDFYRPQLWYCDTLTPIWQQRETYGLKGYHFSWSHDTMDAKTAVELLEKAFLAIDDPVWVPDPGYNFLTLYYLKRRGMSFEKQKTFLKCFNAIIKEKLLYPAKKEISPHLLESLKMSCLYDQPGEPDMRPIEVLAGPGFVEAEAFWVNEFENGSFSSNPETAHGQGALQTNAETGRNHRHLSPPCIIETSLLEQLKSTYETDVSTIVLAAFSTLLSRLYGQEDTTIVTALDEKEAFPLRLNLSWTLSFREFLQTASQKIRQSMAHRLYGFHILTNPQRMKEYGRSCPTFAAAYLVTDGEAVKLEDRLPFYPSVYQGIDLVLRLINHKTNGDVNIQFSYSTAIYGQEAIEKLSNYLVSTLRGIGQNQDIPLKEIALEPEKEKHHLVIETHAAKDFNF